MHPKQAAVEPSPAEAAESSPELFGAAAAFGGAGEAEGAADPFAAAATGPLGGSSDDASSTASGPRSEAGAPAQAEDDFFGAPAATVGLWVLYWAPFVACPFVSEFIRIIAAFSVMPASTLPINAKGKLKPYLQFRTQTPIIRRE